MDKIAYSKGWLQGFFDGEGGAYLQQYLRSNGKPSWRPQTWYVVKVGNTDRALIDATISHLDRLGIAHTVHERLVPSGKGKPKRPYYSVNIVRREAIRRFAKSVGFASPTKKRTIAKILAWIDRPHPKTRDAASGRFS